MAINGYLVLTWATRLVVIIAINGYEVLTRVTLLLVLGAITGFLMSTWTALRRKTVGLR